MSYILSARYARRDDDEFTIAAARALYVDWWCSRMEELGRDKGWSGCELTELAPETQRWAFQQVRPWVQRLAEMFGPDYRDVWRELWDAYEYSDRPSDDENMGWYAAMEAMGHGVGLSDFGIDVRLPSLEAMR